LLGVTNGWLLASAIASVVILAAVIARIRVDAQRVLHAEQQAGSFSSS